MWLENFSLFQKLSSFLIIYYFECVRYMAFASSNDFKIWINKLIIGRKEGREGEGEGEGGVNLR